MTQSAAYTDIRSLNPDWNPARAWWPPDTYKTLVVKCAIAGGRIARVSFLPACIDFDDQPSLISPGDPRFALVKRYMEEISREAGLDTAFIEKGSEVFIDTGR
jgi:hypothetical protein